MNMTVTRGMVTVKITAMTTPPAMRPIWTAEERATAAIVKGRVLETQCSFMTLSAGASYCHALVA